MTRLAALLLILLMPAVAGAQLMAHRGFDPAPPETFETPYSLPTGGTTYTPADSAAFQTDLDACALGDVIVLTAGTTYTGNYTLPAKVGSGWIYIISSDLASLPAGTRVTAADASHMPKVRTTNTAPAIQTEFGSKYYRLCGIEVQATNDLYNIVLLGFDGDQVTDSSDAADLPDHIWFDRCYIHSTDDAKYAVAGILGDGKYIALFDSRVANIKAGPDAQAFVAWYAQGPYKIVNNFLEATGENIMFGGEGVPIANSIPSDIEVCGNHLYKNPAWEVPNTWNVKNLFELKNARRVHVSGNVMENNWVDAQVGVAVLFTPRNQEGDAPWSGVSDVLFENNWVKNSPRGFNVSGEDDLQDSAQTQRIKIVNNLVTELEADAVKLSSVNVPIKWLTIENNTMLLANGEAGNAAVNFADSPPLWVDEFVFRNNLFDFQQYGGVSDSAAASKTTNITKTNNGYILGENNPDLSYWQSNFAGAYTDDLDVDAVANVVFTNFAGGDYSVASGAFNNAGSDGLDVGVDWSALQSAISGVEE